MRDAAPTLERCLASLAAQTLREHEVVAVDDGSSDGSAGILAAWAARDARLHVWTTARRGLVPALATAVGAARADVLARMDADDVCVPERLELQWRRLREGPRVDVLGCRVRLQREDAAATAGMLAYVEWQNGLLAHEDIVRDLLVESPLVHPSVAVPASVLRTLGGYRDFEGPEDYDLWLRAERAGMRFGKLPEVLLEWWDSPARLTRTSGRYAEDRFFDLKVEALLMRYLTPARPVVIWGAGPIGKRWARVLQSRGMTLRAFIDVDPRKIGQRVHGAPVVEVNAAMGLGPALHLAAVGSARGRNDIREAAARLGLADETVAVA